MDAAASEPYGAVARINSPTTKSVVVKSSPNGKQSAPSAFSSSPPSKGRRKKTRPRGGASSSSPSSSNTSGRRRRAVLIKVAAVLLAVSLSATWIIAASFALLHPSLTHPGIDSDGGGAGGVEGGPGSARRRRFFGGAARDALRDSLASLGRGAVRLEERAGHMAERAEAMAGNTLGRMKRRDMGLAQITGGAAATKGVAGHDEAAADAVKLVPDSELGAVGAELGENHGAGGRAAAKAAGGGDKAVGAPGRGAAADSIPGAARAGGAGAEEARAGDDLGGDHATPLLIYACERADYLRRTLDAILRDHPVNKKREGTYAGDVVGSPVIISQDGDDRAVIGVINEYREKFAELDVPVIRMEHEKVKRGHLRGNDAYKALAVHYGWALGRTFSGEAYRQDGDKKTASVLPNPRRVIILEEDIEVAPDFFSFMAATAPLLDTDTSLLAVSAWNDNGKSGMVGDPHRLVRSDFFPGLGWMMPRRIWDDIGSDWPGGWWDDWIREPDVRKGRQSIRPEVSRTLHFGSHGGASNNQFGKDLQQIKLDDQDIRWTMGDEGDLFSYLDRNAFRESYYDRVMKAKPCANRQCALDTAKKSDVRVEYTSWKQFLKVAKSFTLMGEEKAGVPRGGFENIVDFRPSGGGRESAEHLIFVSPPLDKLKQVFEKGRTIDTAGMKDFSEAIRQDPKKKR